MCFKKMILTGLAYLLFMNFVSADSLRNHHARKLKTQDDTVKENVQVLFGSGVLSNALIVFGVAPFMVYLGRGGTLDSGHKCKKNVGLMSSIYAASLSQFANAFTSVGVLMDRESYKFLGKNSLALGLGGAFMGELLAVGLGVANWTSWAFGHGTFSLNTNLKYGALASVILFLGNAIQIGSMITSGYEFL